MNKKFMLLSILSALPAAAFAEKDKGWFIKSNVGISQISSTDGTSSGVGALDGSVDVDLDSGFNAGLGVGYRYSSNVSAEFAWEYRSNDSETTLADGDVFDEGNYASSIFYLNGYYHFDSNGKWVPYVGAGLGWAQEIDIDLERDGVEQSYTGDGEIGFQVFAGLDYVINDQWRFNTELKYASFSSIDLTPEEQAVGSFAGFDYTPVTLSAGLIYSF